MSASIGSVVHAVTTFVLALPVLFVVYPWSVYQENFSFPWQCTLVSYFALALLLTIACSVIPYWITIKRLKKSVVESRLGGAAVFLGVCWAGLLTLAVIFGGIGLGLDIPGTRVQGIFFSEWKFMTFLLYVGGPLCSLTTALMLGLERQLVVPQIR